MAVLVAVRAVTRFGKMKEWRRQSAASFKGSELLVILKTASYVFLILVL